MIDGVEKSEVRASVAQRILWALEACASHGGGLTLTQLTDETGLAKTTVHRMCWSLVDLGLLECSDGRFAVGMKIFALGNSNPLLNEIRVAAMPHLLALQAATGEMSNLAILNGGKALVIDALYAAEPALPRLVGTGLPLHCTAVGKAIAASLDPGERERLLGRDALPPATWRTIVRPSMLREHLGRVAQEGVAVSLEEFMPGVCGVATAIRVRGDTTIAIGFVGRLNEATARRVVTPVRDAARALRSALAQPREGAAVG